MPLLPLPEEFLTEIAKKYELSVEQTEVFRKRFGSEKNDEAIAEELHISPEAVRTRMTGVYNKFSIRGQGPGKFHRLREFLTGEYQKSNASTILDAQQTSLDIEALVQEVRKKVYESTQSQCGTMKVLDMFQPIGLEDIYTNVNILEKISRLQGKEIAESLLVYDSINFERLGLGRVSEKRVPGLDAVKRYTKLMVLGKPGAGKTTFLKYVAIQCNEGKFQAESVPIFVDLKDFAEAPHQPSLLDYISLKLSKYRVTGTQVTNLFNHGRVLALLDGLDEVRDEDNNRVLKEIRNFSDEYYISHFVMTCRIAAREYTFDKFTEVEVADFDEEQIQTFAQKWFQSKEDPVKAVRFITKLGENKPIKELATNPLLLTFLCLVFEESADFPSHRSDLYKEGLDVLLKKWDAKRNIERGQVYKNLSLKRKEDLLSQIALTTFEQENYFFKKKEVELHISEYIRNLPDAKDDPEALQPDSEAVLKSIEAQHGLLVERARGIYSFSHLTFQEYYTAKKIIDSPNPQAQDQALKNLVNHITEKHWREVFFLAVDMLPSADYLLRLMKRQIDELLAADKELQKLLTWVNQKSLWVNAAYKPAAVRALYLDIALDLARPRPLDLASIPTSTLSLALNLDLDFASALALTRTLARTLDLANPRTFAFTPQSLLRQYYDANLLRQYYDANQLLVECLKSDSHSRGVRQEIEETLLLPIAEIQKRGRQSESAG